MGTYKSKYSGVEIDQILNNAQSDHMDVADNKSQISGLNQALTDIKKDLQHQINTLVLESGGDSNLEVVNARADMDSHMHGTLNDRLESDFNKKADKNTVESLQSQVSTNTTKTVDLQSQIDSLVLEAGGDSNPEVVQARTDETGTTHATLKERIDSSVTDLKSDLNKIRNEIGYGAVDFISTRGKAVSSHDGGLVSNWDFGYSDPIHINAGDVIVFNASGASSRTISVISKSDSAGNISEVLVIGTSNDVIEYSYTAIEDCYIVLSFRWELEHTLIIRTGINNSTLKAEISKASESINDLKDEVSENYSEFNNAVNEILVNKNVVNLFTKYENSYRNAQGIVREFNTMDRYEGNLTSGETYRISPNYRFIVVFYTTGSGVVNVLFSSDEEGLTEFTVPENTQTLYPLHVSVTVEKKNADNFAIWKNEDSADVYPIGTKQLRAGLCGNVLYQKKWVSCGDSFTAGGYATADDYNVKNFLYGKNYGKQRTYPYYIEERNNMIVVNEAVSGSCMTSGAGPIGAFSDNRYKQIPGDADYITLYFGINDDNYSAPIGTIDDTTNTTFYGAWNIVIDYLITNHKYAKIGIIITNGSSPQYTEAERNIAKKWGIPYLDLEKDYNVPLMHRVNEREELTDRVKSLRMQSFAVSEYNRHPNYLAHKYESTFIENFLRSL